MIGLASGTRMWLASGLADMRRGFDGLALLMQETLKRDPHRGICSCSVASAAG